MHLTQRILGFTLLGSDWVLWLLIGLSIVSVTVMVERGLALRGSAADVEEMGRELVGRLREGDLTGARALLGGQRSPASAVAAAGLAVFDRGADAVAETMASAKARLRVDLERNLGVLGTLGNNAPFIGLFGTVLGIIKAFADLSRNQTGGTSAVMSGISEALVATAVGLMVAIPAVVGFNFFQGRVRKSLARVDSMAHLVLPAAAPGGARAAGN
jgi:biopolymer transport protein ExbB